MPHTHKVESYNRSFAIGITLNVLFVIIEFSYGLSAESLALIADAGHNLSDVFTLLLAWGASLLSSKKTTKKRTYGFRKITVLASLISSFLLLLALVMISIEAYERLFRQESVDGLVVIVVAAVGVVINAISAALFFKNQKHDLNIKAAYLHMLVDALISLGVVVAGIAIIFTGWIWLDPLISLVIVAVVLVGTWSLLLDSLNLCIDAVPKDIDIDEVEEYLRGRKNISDIHDLHVWATSTTQVALSVHLVASNNTIDNSLYEEIQSYLHDNFGISHTTIQVESEDENFCLLNHPSCMEHQKH